MIRLKDIHKNFNEKAVLRGFSTNFEAGKTNLIIGQSGSGKTVLLKILLGLYTQDKGEIFYDGQMSDAMEDKNKRELKKNSGMLFQNSALFDSLTVEENVIFPLKMFTNQSNEEMLERVNFVLKRVDLDNVNGKLPAQLSGGMKKRVGIARAIVIKPKYLFCDEPNSGLDPKTATLIDNLIQEITHEYQITTVINTHDMNSVIEIGEKIIFLSEGKKQWEGTSQDIFNTDNQSIVDFVFSSNLFKKAKKIYFK